MDDQEQRRAGDRPIETGEREVPDTLIAYYDALLDSMQTPEARAGMRRAFDASPEELGRAAVAAASKGSGSEGVPSR